MNIRRSAPLDATASTRFTSEGISKEAGPEGISLVYSRRS